MRTILTLVRQVFPNPSKEEEKNKRKKKQPAIFNPDLEYPAVILTKFASSFKPEYWQLSEYCYKLLCFFFVIVYPILHITSVSDHELVGYINFPIADVSY